MMRVRPSVDPPTLDSADPNSGGRWICANKTNYSTRKAARKGVHIYFASEGVRLVPYKCRYCPEFHLTGKDNSVVWRDRIGAKRGPIIRYVEDTNQGEIANISAGGSCDTGAMVPADDVDTCGEWASAGRQTLAQDAGR